MFGLSPAKLSQAADGAMFGSPSARLSVDNTAKTTAQSPADGSPSARLSVDNTAKTTAQSLQERISSELQQLQNEQWSSKLPFQGISPLSDNCTQHDDVLTF